jgi:hypothetical protein
VPCRAATLAHSRSGRALTVKYEIDHGRGCTAAERRVMPPIRHPIFDQNFLIARTFITRP